MARPAALGITKFEDIVKRGVFYVDKTDFIREWWEKRDQITLITRPRRFGKTLTLSMVETFFSVHYAQREDLFENFSVWGCETLRQMQGTWPVISLSLANIKPQTYGSMMRMVKLAVAELYENHNYLMDSDKLAAEEKERYRMIKAGKAEDEAYAEALRFLSACMGKHWGKPVLILVDEYDTPMLEAFVAGFWEEAIVFIRRMFHAAFKDNPWLERGLLTGITRITQESIFSDLNNLAVSTTTTEMYEVCFGFTEKEVFVALEEYGLDRTREDVRRWYDGFQFGKKKDIYNPWSILNYLKYKKFEPYWMNTSGNALVGKLIQTGMVDVKQEFECLLHGETVVTEIDESITYADLGEDSKSVWSWLLTTGYLRIVSGQGDTYEVALTNYEVQMSFYRLVQKWFGRSYSYFKNFRQMLLRGDIEGMQRYMDRVAGSTFSYFDVGDGSTESERAEQFYHGFTIGLIADLNATHIVTSNRESGFGRYDVCIEPLDRSQEGIIIEFKIFDPKKENTLEETARRALAQIREKDYEAELRMRGIANVRRYGIAFRGKEALIEEG